MGAIDDERDDAYVSNIDDDDGMKLFISKIPRYVSESLLKEKLNNAFRNTIESVNIITGRDKDTDEMFSKGFGFALFNSREGKAAALEQGYIKMKRDAKEASLGGSKHVKLRISELIREDSLGRGRDLGVCYQWQSNCCSRGDECKFLHEGPGSCLPAPGTGKRSLDEDEKICWNFVKGKCKEGDECSFKHDEQKRAEHEERKNKKRKMTVDESGAKVCFKFLKKGKCRKGCKFSHNVTAPH